MKRITRLGRNLKPGDRFVIRDGVNYPSRGHWVVEVTHIHETCRAWFTGKRQWQISYKVVDIRGNPGILPFSQDGYGCCRVYSTDKFDVKRGKR